MRTGSYEFLRLVPGTYIVRAQLVGFQTVEKSDIRVANDTMTRVDLPMQLGSIEETILVVGRGAAAGYVERFPNAGRVPAGDASTCRTGPTSCRWPGSFRRS